MRPGATPPHSIDVPPRHLMLREQQQPIACLMANLHRLLKWRFGPRKELLDVDQFGLFADGSVVIEVPPSQLAAEAKQSASTAAPAERRRAASVLKIPPRVTEQIGVSERQETCQCYGAVVRARAACDPRLSSPGLSPSAYTQDCNFRALEEIATMRNYGVPVIGEPDYAS